MPIRFMTLVSIVVLSLLARYAAAAGEWTRMENKARVVLAGN